MAKKKTSTKKTTSKKTAKRTASKKTASKKTASKKTASKKTASKKTASKKTASKKTAKRSAAKAGGAAKPKAPSKAKKTTAAKGSPRKAAGKPKGKCNPATCTSASCSARKLDGRALVDRARECNNLDECHGFIRELGEAVEQFNSWLDEMHTQALSAEQTRDLYGEQISDLLEAIGSDEARIAQLEAELKKERSKPSRGRASQAVLDQLTELRKEVKTIRADMRRLLEGREPTTGRRQRVRKAEREAERPQRGRGRARHTPASEPVRASAVMDGRPARRPMSKKTGPFAKYSVLRGAACSLGVGKYGYPPEVCAPAAFSRSEAAEILGTYAQNKYSGLAKWALITGLPIDDVAIPLMPAGSQRGGRRKGGKAASTSSKPKRAGASKARTKASTSTRKAAPRSASKKKSAGSDRSTKQIIDQVLLTVARI